LQIAQSIRALRQRAGLSQRQLAMRMQVPRTYVSKIENEKATPTLSSMERLAKALEVTLPDLLNGGQPSREEQLRDINDDPFLAELLPVCEKLNGMQLASILHQVRELTVRPRRMA
jgi:transcriptional regulator with XRE-family HTH domain